MKQLMTILAFGFLLGTACTDNTATTDKDTNAASETKSETAKSESGCIEGKWTMPENGVTRAFVFKSDKSGQEEYTPTDIRPFTWSLKDDKTVHIIYKGADGKNTGEYDLSVNCEGNALRYYGAVYKK